MGDLALVLPGLLALIATFALGFMPESWRGLLGMAVFLALVVGGIWYASAGLNFWKDMASVLVVSTIMSGISFGGIFGVAGQAVVLARGGRHKGATAAVFAVLMVAAAIGILYYGITQGGAGHGA